MTKNFTASIITGLLPGVLFIVIALYFLFSSDIALAVAKNEVRNYAILTGAYGLWRVIRFSIALRDAEPLQ